ncbi:MAG TPA: hypothetical protein VGJ32_15410, partial [Solirubrobacteraceae bacterium]
PPPPPPAPPSARRSWGPSAALAVLVVGGLAYGIWRLQRPVPAPAPAPAPAPTPDAAPAPAPDAAPAPAPDAAPPDAAPDDDEQAEPVPEIAPDPVAEDEIDTPKPPEPSPPPRADTIRDVRSLIAAGRRGEAIAALERLREKQRGSAYIPYLLGNLYFERKWWTDGLESYRAAIKQNRSYRWRAVLIRNAIRALASNKTAGKARALLLRDVGGSATGYLRAAARGDPNPTVRARAAALAQQLRKRR